MIPANRNINSIFQFRVAFIGEDIALDYDKAMASTRLRVFDVVNYFKKNNIDFELFNEDENYDFVIFQKYFNQTALSKARELKRRGAKIILDVNVNFFDRKFWKNLKKEYHCNDIENFSKIVDGIIVPSIFLFDYIHAIYREIPIFIIEENIPDYFYRKIKKYKMRINKEIKLVYNGTAEKATEILLIKDALFELAEGNKVQYFFICDKDPGIKFKNIKTKFIKYSRKNNPSQLLKGDIYLAPRDLSNTYNLGHSFTKIGAPMSVGLPVVASPVPSYLKSPAILINNFSKAWVREIERLINDSNYYKNISDRGRAYCRENYSISLIANKYLEAISKIKNNEN